MNSNFTVGKVSFCVEKVEEILNIVVILSICKLYTVIVLFILFLRGLTIMRRTIMMMMNMSSRLISVFSK